MTRISIDEYFLKITKVVKLRSTCIKAQHGAVLVKGKHIIATGYNGAPKDIPHCTEETCQRLNVGHGINTHLCRGVHAEANCIVQAAKLGGTSVEGATLYCTSFPCIDCLKLLINAGVIRIVYLRDYGRTDPEKMKLIEDSGIEVTKGEC